MTNAILEVENLGVAFGDHVAVQGLNFELHRGETLALVGESGSGKSATALALMRLIERDGGRIVSGRVTLRGRDGTVDVTQLAPDRQRALRGARMAMIFQEPMTALNPVMTIGAQIIEALSLHRGLAGRAAQAAAIEALGRVQIPNPERRIVQYPHELSGGLRQRVMIAMAISCQPDILIADEPTTALDVTTQAEILGLIKSLQDETGMGVVFITHDMGVVAEIADHTVVLCRGTQVESGPTGELFRQPRAPYTRKLLSAAPSLGSARPPRLCDDLAGAAPVVEIRGLRVQFPVERGLRPLDYHAVNGVDLAILPGETLGLVGESGCGKSTIARALARLTHTSAGDIRLEGRDITHAGERALRPLRPRMQMVFQDPFASLDPRLPVWKLITEPARLAGMLKDAPAARALAARLLDRVSLPEDALTRYAHQFSGGQRQRLCIARALSVKPALVIADEPVSALDVTVAAQITELLADLQRAEGMACLFISHDLAVVERCCHRIAVMYAGQIVETGPTAEVLANPRHPYTRRLLAAVPRPIPGSPRGALPDAPPRPVLLRAPADTLPPASYLAVGKGHLVRDDAIGAAAPATFPASIPATPALELSPTGTLQ